MSILITGGTGFIGVGLAHQLVERGKDIILFDIAPQTERAADIKDKVKIVRGDLKVSDIAGDLDISVSPAEAEMTLSALVLSLLRGQASKGDSVRFKGLGMTVEETVDGDIWMVRINRRPG